MSRLLEEFKEYLKEMNQYDHVTGLLQWDMQTTVPKLGQAAHVDALTYFSTKSFEMGTSEKLGGVCAGSGGIRKCMGRSKKCIGLFHLCTAPPEYD